MFMKMSYPPENTQKSNGFNTDPTERLASFKPSRNLTLGGPKLSKKIFTPNLNVTRNKNKGLTTQTQDLRKDEKSKKDRRQDRYKNNRGGANIIKSGGIFALGPGRAERHHTSYTSHRGEGEPTPLQRPLLRARNVQQINKDVEDQQIRMAMTMASARNDNDFEDFKRPDKPIKLPMEEIGSSFYKSDLLGQVKREIKIKPEMIDPEYGDSLGVVAEPVTVKRETFTVKLDVFQETPLIQLLRSEGPIHILIKMPESLPGRGGGLDDDPRNKFDDTTEEDETPKPCYLKDLCEGRIGKLRIHRSGKVMLAFGESKTKLEVLLGTRSPYLQEIMSVSADDQSRSASAVTLTRLLHKMVVFPVWEDMIKHLL